MHSLVLASICVCLCMFVLVQGNCFTPHQFHPLSFVFTPQLHFKITVCKTEREREFILCMRCENDYESTHKAGWEKFPETEIRPGERD